MKKLITLLLLFTLVGFLSGNQVIITNDYQYIITTEATYNFTDGDESNNVKYDRTNKIEIQNNKVLADILKYHYAFFWDETDTFIGYYKTNKGITTSGSYLGQVNTQSIPLPLNAYSFALVRYDDNYILVNGFTIEDLFIDNNLVGVDPDDFNDIPIAELNNNSLNDIFNRTILKTTTALPNGVKYYEISGGNIIQRVQERTLISSDIDRIDGVSGIVQARVLNGVIINGTFNTLDGKSIVNGYIETATRNLIAPFDKYMHSEGAFGILNALYVAFPVGTTLATAQTALTGTQVLYQLPTPITILNGVSINQAKLDTYYQIWLNGVNATYYATDGNVSSVNGYYYASGKNLFDSNDLESGSFNAATGAKDVLTRAIRTKTMKPILPSTQYRFSLTTAATDALIFYYYDINKVYLGSGSRTFVTPSGGTLTTPANAAYFNTAIVNLATPAPSFNNNYQLEIGGTATTFEAFATPTTTLNLTFLFGVGNEPNKAAMDGYYQDYEDWQDYSFILPLAFNTQTISFETIYFDDGVSTEIEQLGSILIFTLIGFTLMIFGFASKRRIFNLLAVGAFVVLGFLLIEFVGFIIILFGLIFVNVYYTFFGEL